MRQRTHHHQQPVPTHPRLLGLLLPIYTLSGLCALALETIWIRAFAVRIGNTTVSATLVIAVFFLCAALGNLWGGRLAKQAAHPLVLYGRLEFVSGLSAALLFPFRDALYQFTHQWIPLTGDAFVPAAHLLYVVLMIGLPSFFAGGAFPALSEAFIARTEQRTALGGALYAGNLLGAALGVLIGGILLPWWWGYRGAFCAVASGQLLIGVVVMLAGRRHVPAAHVPHSELPAAEATISPRVGTVILIASGVLSIMLEMLAMSYFQQLTAGSLYAMSAVLFAFIINLGLGSGLAALLRRGGVRTVVLLGIALTVSSAQLLCYPALLHHLLTTPLLPPMTAAAGWAMRAVLTATALFAPLLLAVGMVFPLAWEVIERSNHHHGQAIAHAVAVNKVGCAVGALLGPFVLVPLLGLPMALMSAGWVYLALAIAVGTALPLRMPARVALAVAVVALLGMAVMCCLTCKPPVVLAAGEHLRALYQGADGVTAVVEDARGSRHIVLNQNYTLNGTDRAVLSQQQESWLPLLLCEQPERVVFIGMASGISATAALDFPIKELCAVELVPEVKRAAFEQFRTWNRPLFTDPRAQVLVNDGRFVVQNSRSKADLVICDLFLPALEGTSALYSRDFFSAVRVKLAPHGKCCLWLPAYQLDEAMLGIVLRTFLEVFPHAIVIRGNFDPLQPTVGLIGANEPIDLSTELLTRQLQTDAARAIAPRSPFFRSVANARLALIGDLRAISAQVQGYPLNSDDTPVFAFRGAKWLAPGTALRGYPFLRWFGTRFLDAGFPSCSLGATPAAGLERGMRAGNYYFAASIANMAIPESLEHSLQRARQTSAYLKQAALFSPSSTITPFDLGR